MVHAESTTGLACEGGCPGFQQALFIRPPSPPGCSQASSGGIGSTRAWVGMVEAPGSTRPISGRAVSHGGPCLGTPYQPSQDERSSRRRPPAWPSRPGHWEGGESTCGAADFRGVWTSRSGHTRSPSTRRVFTAPGSATAPRGVRGGGPREMVQEATASLYGEGVQGEGVQRTVRDRPGLVIPGGLHQGSPPCRRRSGAGSARTPVRRGCPIGRRKRRRGMASSAPAVGRGKPADSVCSLC